MFLVNFELIKGQDDKLATYYETPFGLKTMWS